MKIFEHWRMWHIDILGLINTCMIKPNALYGNVVFRALQSRYLLLFLYIHAYEFRGSKILSQPEDRITILMFSVILSLNCLLIPLAVKSNTHPFYTAVAAIRCMLLFMLKEYWNVSTKMQPKGQEKTVTNDFQRAQNYLWKACSFEFLSSHCGKSTFWSYENSSLPLFSTNKTLHINLNQVRRLLIADHNSFHTCSVLWGWEKVRWYFVCSIFILFEKATSV